LHVKSAINTGITHSQFFQVIDAAIEAGATLEELKKIAEGKYANWFLAMLISWHDNKKLIEMHQEEASKPKPKGHSGRGSKR
jgi:hypothetical protein